jgi:hypothetical protein
MGMYPAFIHFDFDKNRIKWYHHLWLWLYPTRILVDIGLVAYYKLAFGKM